MRNGKTIKTQLRSLMPQVSPIISGKVLEVDGMLCSVALADGFELKNIRLKATPNDQEYFLLTPAVGSTVKMISETGDMSNLLVVQIDDVEKIEVKHNDFDFVIDTKTKKVKIANNQYSFKKMMDDLTALLQTLTVSTANGPSGTPLPPTIQKIIQLKTNYAKLLD